MNIGGLIKKYNLYDVCGFIGKYGTIPKMSYKKEGGTIKFIWRANWETQKSEIKIDDFISNVNLAKLLKEEDK